MTNFESLTNVTVKLILWLEKLLHVHLFQAICSPILPSPYVRTVLSLLLSRRQQPGSRGARGGRCYQSKRLGRYCLWAARQLFSQVSEIYEG